MLRIIRYAETVEFTFKLWLGVTKYFRSKYKVGASQINNK